MSKPSRLVAVAALTGLLVIGAVAAAYWAEPSDSALRLRPDDGAIVARGAAIYAESCAACHGKNLEGQPNWRQRLPTGRLAAPPHDETGHTWHHADELLFRITKLGPAAVVGGTYKSDMPAYDGTLSDRKIIAVLSYIKSTWPDPVRDRHDMINERHRERR